MSNAADKIRKLSLEAAEKKKSEREIEVQKLIDADIAVIERILKLVKDRLIYKEVGQYSRKKYVVVTEDIALNDYANPSTGYSKETSIKQNDGGYYSYPHVVIRLGGHVYQYAGDLIAKYKYEADQAMKKADQEYEAAKRRKEAIDNLEDLEPVIKELMLNYQEKLGLEKQEL